MYKCIMHKSLASEMACFAICQLGWTTPLINDWTSISLYADKGEMSFREKRVPYVVHFVF